LIVGFHPRSIDDDPQLLEQSYQLRYQVYCVERHFLPADNYPDGREMDAFDQNSIHVAALDEHGAVVATARVVKPGSAGLPLFRYCTVFPLVTALDVAGTVAVEISRVSISRHYARRPGDVRLGGVVVPGEVPGGPVVGGHERRRRSGEPFLTLLKAVISAARSIDATHLIFAIEPALERWLVHFGFPCRLSGPEADYYGRVAPYIVSLAELDDVIRGRQFPALEDFPLGVPCLSSGPSAQS
jgi:N-acyl amino acid synthase of PEP-CTERM/exosortase system